MAASMEGHTPEDPIIMDSRFTRRITLQTPLTKQGWVTLLLRMPAAIWTAQDSLAQCDRQQGRLLGDSPTCLWVACMTRPREARLATRGRERQTHLMNRHLATVSVMRSGIQTLGFSLTLCPWILVRQSRERGLCWIALAHMSLQVALPWRTANPAHVHMTERLCSGSGSSPMIRRMLRQITDGDWTFMLLAGILIQILRFPLRYLEWAASPV